MIIPSRDRLFLTPGSSPSFPLVLATNPAIDERSIGTVSRVGSKRSNHTDLRATISRNPASWLKYPARAHFFHDEIFTSCGLFPQFSTCFPNAREYPVFMNNNKHNVSHVARGAANPIELQRNPFLLICPLFLFFTYHILCINWNKLDYLAIATKDKLNARSYRLTIIAIWISVYGFPLSN